MPRSIGARSAVAGPHSTSPVAAKRDPGHAQGAAFLIATHDDRLLARCDRVLRLHDGAIADDRQPFLQRA